MFTRLYHYFYTLFSTDFYKRNKNIPEKNIWVNKQLENWKKEMYYTNRSLMVIPQSRIFEQKIKYNKEYDNLFKQ